MYGSEIVNFSLWWLCPIFMIILCIIMMRGRRGFKMCGFSYRDKDDKRINASDSAVDILDKRYAFGKINKEEYEEIKRTLTNKREIFE